MKQMKTIDGLTGMNIGYDDTTYTKLGKLQNVLRTSVRNFFRILSISLLLLLHLNRAIFIVNVYNV